jgi:hypothetical protein
LYDNIIFIYYLRTILNDVYNFFEYENIVGKELASSHYFRNEVKREKIQDILLIKEGVFTNGFFQLLKPFLDSLAAVNLPAEIGKYLG